MSSHWFFPVINTVKLTESNKSFLDRREKDCFTSKNRVKFKKKQIAG